MVQDAIEKRVVINAPKEQVFEAISDPAKITGWFPNAVEGTLQAGERAVLDFGKSGKAKIYVVAVTPYDYFAYNWVPGSAAHVESEGKDVLERPHTLVEFRLLEEDGKTTVVVKESGFAGLPEDMYEKAYSDNTGGWAFMMGRLEKFMSA